jgi:rubredoxin
MRSFEGSYLGDAGKIGARTRLECKVCWYVYDPAAGDDLWQVPPGTPFSELPEHWSCPNCEGSREQFMVLDAA